MKNFFYNIGYFLREVKTIFQLNLVSNIFSIFSTGLIFFILALVISGWWGSSQVVEVIQEEAEINLYFDKKISSGDHLLVEEIEGMKGVREARIVDEAEAYARMEEILGKEARVLGFFDENPFSPFVEVKINLEEIDPVLEELNQMSGLEHIRDNREILERLGNIEGVLRFLGYLAVIAVGISTLVIISHIIKLGIYNNREQINTLRLLGAPEFFIAFPFLLEGLLLTLGGGIFAVTLTTVVLKQVYTQITGTLPFIPLPSMDALVKNLTIVVMGLSVTMGIIGGFLGLSSEKGN